MSETEEKVAKAIKAELDTFSDPVRFYVETEARSRWENSGSVGPEPEYHDFESYRIIARAALAAIGKIGA